MKITEILSVLWGGGTEEGGGGESVWLCGLKVDKENLKGWVAGCERHVTCKETEGEMEMTAIYVKGLQLPLLLYVSNSLWFVGDGVPFGNVSLYWNGVFRLGYYAAVLPASATRETLHIYKITIRSLVSRWYILACFILLFINLYILTFK